MSWEKYAKNYRKYLKKVYKWSSFSNDDDDNGIDRIEIVNRIEYLGFTEIK